MNRLWLLPLIPLATLALTQCIVVDENGNIPGTSNPGSAPSYGQPLTAINGRGTVVIMEGSRRVAVCNTASPNIEQTRFIDEQNQIVVKSRGNHGPATVELFNARTGRLKGTVKAFELANGGPAWANGMAD